MSRHDAPKAVLVVCDSLRADLVDSQTSPALARLAAEGTRFATFRSVFPSTTRTSAASIATGCRPAAHGLLGNTMALDEGAGLVCVSAGKPDFLHRLRRATGHALRRPTMHERVARVGHAVAMSNVSPGAAYAHDPEGAGYVYHRSGSFGPGREPLDPGLDIAIGGDGDGTMTERFCREVLEERSPPYAVLWLSEPDHTGHHHALGSPRHRSAIAAADACVARVRDTIHRLDPAGERILLAVCSDHGMQTVRKRIDVIAALVAAGLKDAPDSGDVVVAPQGTAVLLSFSVAAETRVPDVVAWLERQPFTGRIIVGEALASVGLPADGRLRVAVGLAGDDAANDFGVRGRSDVADNALGGESQPGHGQHGGLARYEQAPFLFVHGGGFVPGVRSEAISLIDLAPMFLRHLSLPAQGVEGRAPERDAAPMSTAADVGRRSGRYPMLAKGVP